MRKFLLSFMFLLGITVISDSFGVANAQVCKISETNDNVEVFSCFLDGEHVSVTLSNDSENIKANVTVTVEVQYGNGTLTKSFTGKIMAKPGGSTDLKIPIDPKFKGYSPSSVKVTSISGTKCL